MYSEFELRITLIEIIYFCQRFSSDLLSRFGYDRIDNILGSKYITLLCLIVPPPHLIIFEFFGEKFKILKFVLMMNMKVIVNSLIELELGKARPPLLPLFE